jgi:hypothetical protein
MITVTRQAGDDPLVFDVVVAEPNGASHHRVAASRADLARLAGARSQEAVIDAAFRFLLEREPKESILARFDLSVIARYFPEFERELPRYFAAGE